MLAAMITCTAMGWIGVPTCLGFVFLLMLHIWNVMDAAKARVSAGLRQAQADEELAKTKERLGEAEMILREFYSDFRGLQIAEIARINCRAYVNKYLR